MHASQMSIISGASTIVDRWNSPCGLLATCCHAHRDTRTVNLLKVYNVRILVILTVWVGHTVTYGHRTFVHRVTL